MQAVSGVSDVIVLRSAPARAREKREDRRTAEMLLEILAYPLRVALAPVERVKRVQDVFSGDCLDTSLDCRLVCSAVISQNERCWATSGWEGVDMDPRTEDTHRVAR